MIVFWFRPPLCNFADEGCHTAGGGVEGGQLDIGGSSGAVRSFWDWKLRVTGLRPQRDAGL